MGSAKIRVADEIVAEAGGLIPLLRVFPAGSTLDDVRRYDAGYHELVISNDEIPPGLHRANPSLERLYGGDVGDVVVFRSWGLEDAPTY